MHQAPALAIQLNTAAATGHVVVDWHLGICAFGRFDRLAFIQSVGAVPRAQTSSQARCIQGSLRHICFSLLSQSALRQKPHQRQSQLPHSAANSSQSNHQKARIGSRCILARLRLRCVGAHPPVSGCWSHADRLTPNIAAT